MSGPGIYDGKIAKQGPGIVIKKILNE